MSQIDIRPVSRALGAEILGIDLSKPIDEGEFALVQQAFLEHQVLFFREQSISPEQHLALGRRFGALDIHPYAVGLPDHPEVLPVIKEAEDRGGNFGGTWHSDVTFYECPALGSILYALEVPAYGGDTMFASQYLAYDALSAGMRHMLDGMTAVHSASRAYGAQNSRTSTRQAQGGRSMQIRTGDDAQATVEHPVVRTHPETGRKGLFVNAVFTQRFSGWTEAESQSLLDYLYAHAVSPEFTCRFRWQNGSIAFWDNRCVQHYALNDYHGQRREMHRVTIKGDRPFSDERMPRRDRAA